MVPGRSLSPADPPCNPPGRGTDQCVGITNATAEYIHLMPWTMDHAGWFPSTVPWGEDETSGSKNITLRNPTAWGSWADGINFHGGHKNALVEGCEISYTGDGKDSTPRRPGPSNPALP